MTLEFSQDDTPAPGSGYVADTDFRSGFVSSQQPTFLGYTAARAGYAPPDPAGPFRYLELGCGAGVTLNGLAAANPESEFIGVDFNAGHVGAARQQAKAAGLDNVRYVEDSFSEVDVEALGEVDFAALFGTYSWLDPVMENAVLEIARRSLRPGGLFYLSHMMMPAKAPIAPLWRVMREFTRNVTGSSLARDERGMEVLSLLRDAGAGYLRSNPQAAKVLERDLTRLENNREATLHHLAHQALAESWEPRYATEVLARVSELGFVFAGSTHLETNSLQSSLPQELHGLAAELGDRALIELLKDVYANRHQRCDVFIKEGTADPEGGAQFLTSRLHFRAMLPHDALWRRWSQTGPARGIVPGPLMKELSRALDSGWTHLGALITASEVLRGQPWEIVAGALDRVLALGHVEICRREPIGRSQVPIESVATTTKFSRLALRHAVEAGESAVLASPVLGSCLRLRPAQAVALADTLGWGPVPLSREETIGRIASIIVAGGELAAPGGEETSPLKLAEAILESTRRRLVPDLIDLGVLA
jgi:SAM-dependent methyltransferase